MISRKYDSHQNNHRLYPWLLLRLKWPWIFLFQTVFLHHFPLWFSFRHKPLHGLEAIWRDGHAVGFLRSADYAFTLNKSIGYGYIRCPDGGVVDMKFLKSGTYHIESKGELIPAQIHTKTPFDPQNKRVKGIYEWLCYQ